MKRARSFLLPLAAAALAGVLAFSVRQFLERAAVAQERPPQDAPAKSPPPLASKQTVAPEPGPDPDSLESRTAAELLAAACELHREEEWLAFATTACRWLAHFDQGQLEKELAAWKEADDGLPAHLVNLATMRWAEFAPERVLAQPAAEPFARQAAYAAMLVRDADGTLESCPEEMREFCHKFIAARHPRFDLAWARAHGVSPSWFVRIWLHRGLRASELLANPDALDAEIVTTIFLHEATRPGGRDAARLLALLKLLKDPAHQEAAREGIRQTFGWIEDPLATLKMFEQLEIPLPERKDGPYVNPSDYFHQALSDRPEETVAWLLSLKPEERKMALGGIFNSSMGGDKNTRGWLELWLRLPRDELPDFFRLQFYLRHELDDPAGTIAWFDAVAKGDQFPQGDKEHSSRHMFLRLAREIGSELVRNGLASALAQARAIEDEELRQTVLGGIGTRVAEFDREAARELLPELNEAERIRLSSQIFSSEFAEFPLQDALEKLRAAPDAKQRVASASAVFNDSSLPSSSRAAVIDQFREEVPHLFDMSLGLVIKWTNEAPTEAAAWLGNYAEHRRYPNIAEHLVETWARSDISAAATWVIEQDPGPARDLGIEAIAKQALTRDPHSALEWASSLADDKKRLAHLSQAVIAIDTHATEPDEARAAIANLGLSDEERTDLLQRLKE